LLILNVEIFVGFMLDQILSDFLDSEDNIYIISLFLLASNIRFVMHFAIEAIGVVKRYVISAGMSFPQREDELSPENEILLGIFYGQNYFDGISPVSSAVPKTGKLSQFMSQAKLETSWKKWVAMFNR
jgi:hypothetical protein